MYWFIQSVWVSVRGVKKEFDEAKLRFAAAEVCGINMTHLYCLLRNPDAT
jgi:ATP-dependent RNA helicase DDX35